MARVRVKVCGVTSVDDARAAVDAGADAIGLNCFGASPRYIPPETVAEIVAAVDSFVVTVALFVNPSIAEVENVIDRANVDRLQFHGDEPAAFCRGFTRRYIKAVGVGPDFCFETIQTNFADADAFILDAHAPTLRGGTGQTFDWSDWPTTDRRLVLAGGLDADNVGRAIEATHTRAVDVATGIEKRGDKRAKDHTELERFMAAVRRAEAQHQELTDTA